MKIGIVADTHSREVPKQLLKDFKSVDLIIHAGDFCSLKDLEIFTKIKDVEAVYGNMDDPQIRKLFPEKQVITLEGFKIGLFHGEGPAKRTLEFTKEKFKNDSIDIVIFGHSHIPFNETIDDVLYFNPGSPNDMITAPYCAYGILELKNDKITAKEIKVKE